MKDKKKGRNPWNSSEESSTGEAFTLDERDEVDADDHWMKTIRKSLKEWARKSFENRTMRMFVDQVAQMGPQQRNEAVRVYGETLQEFPDMAVSLVRWMVDVKAEEDEKARLRELIRRKDEEGYFRKGSGPEDKFDIGRHQGTSFKEVYLWDQGYLLSMDVATAAATGQKAFGVQILFAADGRHHGQGRAGQRKSEGLGGGHASARKVRPRTSDGEGVGRRREQAIARGT